MGSETVITAWIATVYLFNSIRVLFRALVVAVGRGPLRAKWFADSR